MTTNDDEREEARLEVVIHELRSMSIPPCPSIAVLASRHSAPSDQPVSKRWLHIVVATFVAAASVAIAVMSWPSSREEPVSQPKLSDANNVARDEVDSQEQVVGALSESGLISRGPIERVEIIPLNAANQMESDLAQLQATLDELAIRATLLDTRRQLDELLALTKTPIKSDSN